MDFFQGIYGIYKMYLLIQPHLILQGDSGALLNATDKQLPGLNVYAIYHDRYIYLHDTHI